MDDMDFPTKNGGLVTIIVDTPVFMRSLFLEVSLVVLSIAEQVVAWTAAKAYCVNFKEHITPCMQMHIALDKELREFQSR
jgi:hypothetical protein